MKRIFTAAIAAIALAGAIPAKATTFPALTTIYVASGIIDNGLGFTPAGIATVISCSNMSGQTASVRYIFRIKDGTIVGTATLLLGNLAQQTIATDGAFGYLSALTLPTGGVNAGTLQILSTQSAIFCSAMLVRADADEGPAGVALHMVRFNPHPGTVE